MKPNVIEFTRSSDTPDANFSSVRGNAVLEKLVRRYPGDARSLMRAHDVLNGDPNYGPAMHRVALSLHEGYIQTFISYHVGVDTEAARTVADVFRVLSADKVRVTFADDFTAKIPGQDYKSEIESATKSSQWFVILASESVEPSSWCMYETGMFRATATSRKMERLICLHHPNAALPRAIDGFQSVIGDLPHLQRFLDGLFRQPDPLPGWDALNPDLDDATILEAATRIASGLRPPRKPVEFNYGVTLQVVDPRQLSEATDLGQCLIETDLRTANLFGKIEPPRTWASLVANLQSANNTSPWLVELVAVLKKAAGGNVFRPITGTFESAQGGRVMRPVLHAMEHDGVSDEHRFKLYFLEEFSSSPTSGIAPPTKALLRTVHMHNRVRWEVLEQFIGAAWSRDNIEACSKAFSRIEREVNAQGPIDTMVLRAHFSGAAAVEITEITAAWKELRDPESGSLTLALKGFDSEGVRRGLMRCRDLNCRFVELAFPVLEEITGQWT